jgi:diguanylate cyclase (GGDEF)-like protein
MKTVFGASFIPGGLIFLVAIGFLRPHGLPDWAHTPIAALPGIVLMFGLIFGWYLASSRVVLSLLVLSLTQCALYVFPPIEADQGSPGQTVFALLTLLVPLNLLALSIVKEDAIATWRGLLRLTLICAQPLIVLWLSRPGQIDLAEVFRQPLLPVLTTSWTVLSQPALLAFVGAVALLMLRFVIRQNPMDAGTIWAVLATFVAFHGIQYGWSPVNFLSTAGLTLFLTLVQSSYRQAYCDPLTGISGKPAYEEATAALGRQYVIAVVGIDQFKQYSNQYGKVVGEQLLCVFAPKVAAGSGSGRVFRLGGEEFIILFSGKTPRETLGSLETIRKSIESSVCFLRRRHHVWMGAALAEGGPHDDAITVTVSVGVAGSVGKHDTPALVAKSAYRTLYEAKGEGGNQVKRDTISTGARRPAANTGGRIVAYSELGV